MFSDCRSHYIFPNCITTYKKKRHNEQVGQTGIIVPFFERYQRKYQRKSFGVKLSDRKKSRHWRTWSESGLCAISRLPRNRISDWLHRSFPFRWHSGSSSTGRYSVPGGNLAGAAPDRVGYRARFTAARTEESNVSERFMHLAWHSLATSHMATHRDIASRNAKRTACTAGRKHNPRHFVSGEVAALDPRQFLRACR